MQTARGDTLGFQTQSALPENVLKALEAIELPSEQVSMLEGGAVQLSPQVGDPQTQLAVAHELVAYGAAPEVRLSISDGAVHFAIKPGGLQTVGGTLKEAAAAASNALSALGVEEIQLPSPGLRVDREGMAVHGPSVPSVSFGAEMLEHIAQLAKSVGRDVRLLDQGFQVFGTTRASDLTFVRAERPDAGT